MTILDLGCGWGSVTLFVAKNFPKIRVFSLSNSATQREFIESHGLKNVTVFTGDVAVFQNDEFNNKFDRIISIGKIDSIRCWHLPILGF
jgi:cyclopropane-fatty-acyl-phospholipid synthase